MSKRKLEYVYYLGSGYHLICPRCDRVDPATVEPDEIVALKERGAGSQCIDCDPAARRRIPYRLAKVLQ